MLGVASGFGQGPFAASNVEEMDELSSGIWIAAGGYREGSGHNCHEIFSRGRNARGSKERRLGGDPGGSRSRRDGASQSDGERACTRRARRRDGWYARQAAEFREGAIDHRSVRRHGGIFARNTNLWNTVGDR